LKDLIEGDAMVGVDVLTRVGERFDLGGMVEESSAAAEREGGSLAVVVSGPPGMADEVRLAVARVAGRGRVVEFVEESYSW
jgi:hypothetical protein